MEIHYFRWLSSSIGSFYYGRTFFFDGNSLLKHSRSGK
ncbi:hypothetical protein HMPREF1145_0564 [Oribacterium parvum ACB8]|nr:hypothetical protein HMPREF1145_0564 [Oribacterium parvum ACB8]